VLAGITCRAHTSFVRREQVSVSGLFSLVLAHAYKPFRAAHSRCLACAACLWLYILCKDKRRYKHKTRPSWGN